MKRRVLRFGFVVVVIIAIFIPGFSKIQEIRSRSERLEKEITHLKGENSALEEKIDRLNNDPVYLESIAREKMGVARKGEIVYKIVPEEE